MRLRFLILVLVGAIAVGGWFAARAADLPVLLKRGTKVSTAKKRETVPAYDRNFVVLKPVPGAASLDRPAGLP